VHAEATDENRAVRLHNIERFVRKSQVDQIVARGGRETIGFFASCYARSAPDAACGVDQNRFAHFFDISDKWQVGHNAFDKSPARKIHMHAMCREIQQFRLTKVLYARVTCT
jgi:hypothetical protein